jgi:hypothetical protein
MMLMQTPPLRALSLTHVCEGANGSNPRPGDHKGPHPTSTSTPAPTVKKGVFRKPVRVSPTPGGASTSSPTVRDLSWNWLPIDYILQVHTASRF